MKTKIKMLIFALMVGGMACLISCEKDEGGGDPNDVCDVNLCSNNNDLKQECIDAYNECVDNSPNPNVDECELVALNFCGL